MDCRRIVVHWYHGPESIFRKLADLGCFFSFGCEVRYSQEVPDLLALAPEDRLLAETDNPRSEIWLGGARDDPGLIRRVIADMAAVLGKSPVDMETLVERNSLTILRDAGIAVPASGMDTGESS
ncbi:MAG: TatD family hydrolase [Rectinemataceae bacterium]|nr:TatD family hydrolase [Rectinemataceae bacterium]